MITTQIILMAVCCVLAGIAKAAMDVVRMKYHDSIFATFNDYFWDERVSWMNKWKDGDPEKGERFFLSSTLFVFLTDGWHLMQFLFLLFSGFQVVIGIWMEGIPWWGYLIYLVAGQGLLFRGTFELFHSKIFT